MEWDSRTRTSLLMQVRDVKDHAAWARFVDLYGPMIHTWCLQWNLQDADARDVTQSLIVKLYEVMHDFRYDQTKGSFRGWLRTVTRNAVYNLGRERNDLHHATGDSGVRRQLQNEPARADLARRIQEGFDLELLDTASRKVRKRVAAHTWRAFEMIEYENVPVAEIAAETGLQIAMVYVARSKVKKMLTEELSILNSDGNHE